MSASIYATSLTSLQEPLGAHPSPLGTAPSCCAADPPRPFDFLIDGEILRRSLHKHLLAGRVSAEAVLEVEYVPAVLPPKPREDLPHDDWCATSGSHREATGRPRR